MIRQTLKYICLFCCFQNSSRSAIKLSFPGRPTRVDNFLAEVAAKSQSSGSLTVSGSCTGDNGIVPLLTYPPEGPFRDLEDALRSLERADKYVTWSRGLDGNFRVRDSRVPNDILGIRVHDFHIDNAQGISDAIFQLLKAPEIKSYLLRNTIERGMFSSHDFGQVPSGLPRYSAELHDVTLAVALDRIIAFYPGLWIYSECQTGSTRRVIIRGSPVRWPNVLHH
jgi:hypothetical protein